MKIINFFIIASFISSLAFNSVADATDKAKALKQLIETSTNEDKLKETLCALVAFNAHSVYSLATSESNIPKSAAERVLEMDSFSKDSLQYELNRMAIDDGYKKISSEVTYKKIMSYCTSKTLEQVENMHTGQQETLDEEAWQKAWDEEDCTRREDDMWKAKNANFDGESNDVVRNYLKSVKNSELEQRMLQVLQQDESVGKDEAFQELTYEFTNYCGQDEQNQ